MPATKLTPAERAVAEALKTLRDAREHLAELQHERRTLELEHQRAKAAVDGVIRASGRRHEPLDATKVATLRRRADELDAQMETLTLLAEGAQQSVDDAHRALIETRADYAPQLADRLEQRADDLLAARAAMLERHKQEAAEQQEAELQLMRDWEAITSLAAQLGLCNGTWHGEKGQARRDTLRPQLRIDDPDPSIANAIPQPHWPSWLTAAHEQSVRMAEAEREAHRQRTTAVGF